jgi:hypothetical protein
LPIPEGLWAAAEAAREHGVFRTAKALRLEYGKLKRMVESSAANAKPAEAKLGFEVASVPSAQPAGKGFWTNHERRAAQARALSESYEYILPARFDDTEIEGLLPPVNYIDLRKCSPHEVCVLLYHKLGRDPLNSKAHAVASIA